MGSSKPALQVDVVTLFPEMFGALASSIPGRAQQRGNLVLRVHTPRDETEDLHRTVDDSPYGGGGGMVLKPEPIFRTVDCIREKHGEGHVLLVSPQGQVLTQALVEELADRCHWILICGHYKGVDERIREHLIDQEVSLGDYVLSGGELAAMVLIDAATRLLPDVVGNPATVWSDSFTTGLLDCAHYTRPAIFRSWRVPDVLLSGDHGAVAGWRREQSLLRTLRRRPDLLDMVELTNRDIWFLREHGWSRDVDRGHAETESGNNG